MNKDEGLFKCPLKKSAIDSSIGIMSLVIKMTGYAKKDHVIWSTLTSGFSKHKHGLDGFKCTSWIIQISNSVLKTRI